MTDRDDTTTNTDSGPADRTETENDAADGETGGWNDEEDDRRLFSEEVQETDEDIDSASSDGSDGEADSGGVSEWAKSNKELVVGVTSTLGLVVAVGVLWVSPPLWRYGLLAFALGMLPGVTLFPWITSPFGPGLWVLSEPFARIHFTISQVIRKVGVLVKRSSNEYELGTYDEDEEVAVLRDGTLPIDESNTRWGLFGKRKLGVTWEFGTDVYERIVVDESRPGAGEVVEDGREQAQSSGADGGVAAADGRGSVSVSLNAAHRLFKGVNESDTITRTKEHAEAEYGGGDEDLGGLVMALLVMLMLLLGSATTYLML